MHRRWPVSVFPHAVAAVQRGMHVFPVEPLDKTPIRLDQTKCIEDAPWRLKWSKAATNDLSIVAKWWQHWPTANYGVACRQSGLLVVDCDTAKEDNNLRNTNWAYMHDMIGLRVDGELVFEEMCDRYKIPWRYTQHTFSVRSRKGGLHMYFSWPRDVQSTQASLLNGVVDIRGNGGDFGGYVVGPGSVTPTGNYSIHCGNPVLPAPPQLVELCTDRPYEKPTREYERAGGGGTGNYSGLVRKIENMPENNRNAALLWCARSMCTDGADLDEAERLLGDAAVVAGLKHADAIATIRSGYRLQGRKS